MLTTVEAGLGVQEFNMYFSLLWGIFEIFHKKKNQSPLNSLSKLIMCPSQIVLTKAFISSLNCSPNYLFPGSSPLLEHEFLQGRDLYIICSLSPYWHKP